MNTLLSLARILAARRWTRTTIAVAALAATVPARALDLQVRGPDGEQVSAFRWLIEEDRTFAVLPGDPSTNWAIDFHRSYMPVVQQGDESDAATVALDGLKHYFISVLPDEGYAMGGAQVAPGQAAVTVYVNRLPLPTAQIRVLVFEDNQPINGAPDTPAEHGLEGFNIVLEDAGGRYGMSAGMMTMDAFGNPLGTTYDAAGNALMMGTGVIKTDASGEVLIRNLSPGKYGVTVVPPPGAGWIQTSTIEGKRVIDAWVKANEPAFFTEFGPPGYHVFVGFVKAMHDTAELNGVSPISGRVVNMHLSRPPDTAFYNGAPFVHTRPWVGLNKGAAGTGSGVYAQPVADDGSFSIPNVPAGSYQLVVWDEALDLIFARIGVTVPAEGGAVALGEVPVFQWFTRLEHYVFNDRDQDGFRDCQTAACDDPAVDEVGIPEQAVNLRWRDGSMYQSMATDGAGFVPFDEVFPFFSWLVAEVDFARFKATGATLIVDDGGPIDPDDPWSFAGILNPQPQPEQGGAPYRTETGPVLVQGFQGFLGQTSVIQWGKASYGPGENGGISGIVYYSTTRAESDPRYGAAEPWEPGIPGVVVNLYDAGTGVLLNSTVTDSWDASQPGGCPGDVTDVFYLGGKCYDGMRNWNQVRPAVFDGGYAFGSIWSPAYGAVDAVELEGIPTGDYVVEVVPPAGYEIVKEEDRNVDFGENYTPSAMLLPPVCVGASHLVPDRFSLFPLTDDNGLPVAPYGAGLRRPLCDRKRVELSDGRNAAADFFLFTQVPIAGHIVGMILDDTANEFDPRSPQFGEKYAPPWMPVSIRDWTGREIARVYSDQWGRYNALVPSTFTMDRPMPSGASPNMLTVCLNDAGRVDPASGQYQPDPYFNPQYSQFCYTLQYMPGTTTYLDTPVVRVAAFAGPDQFPLDCRAADGTPEIAWVTNAGGIPGPFVPTTGTQLVIESSGFVEVPNPSYQGPFTATTPTTMRDYSFGSVPGTVTVSGVPLTDVAWSPFQIRGTVAAGTTSGQLEIVRGDNGQRNVVGLTVSVGTSGRAVHSVSPSPDPRATPLQDAIDRAASGDLILVAPGQYEELVILWKPVRLQGWGAGSTAIKALKVPAEKLQLWRASIEQLLTANLVDLLPAQEVAFGGVEPEVLFNEEGPGILVLGRDVPAARGGFGLLGDGQSNARIDGLTISAADHAGGIMVNGYARDLVISNNRIVNNSGVFGGGIRVGHPTLTEESGGGLRLVDANNDRVRIHHNDISQNGSLGGAGGGIALCTGTDGYLVSDNFICGNFTLGEGAGIGHLGLSSGSRIERNTIVFNQSFNQGNTVSGGGILISGGAPLNGPDSVSRGSGSVTIDGNRIQGNLAGAGDGGGIRAAYVNGQDVRQSNASSNNPAAWYRLDILDNLIVDNVAALAGGAISLQDVARVNILHNTIAHNDSTATAGEAFTLGTPMLSSAQPAGLVARAHSSALAASFGAHARVAPYREFANPLLVDNILWHNRAFHFEVDQSGETTAYLLKPDVAAGEPEVYWDLAVLGTAVPRQLTTLDCLVSDTPGAHPDFDSAYVNGARSAVVLPEVTSAIQAPPAFDEGGNFIDVSFGPLTLNDPVTGLPLGSYHLGPDSTAIDAGTDLTTSYPDLLLDLDGDLRPRGVTVDIGADER